MEENLDSPPTRRAAERRTRSSRAKVMSHIVKLLDVMVCNVMLHGIMVSNVMLHDIMVSSVTLHDVMVRNVSAGMYSCDVM